MAQNEEILAEMEQIQGRIQVLEAALAGDMEEKEKDDAAAALVSLQADLSALTDSLEDEDYVGALMGRRAELNAEAQKHFLVLQEHAEPRLWPADTLAAITKIYEELAVIEVELDEEMSPLQKSEEKAKLMAEATWWRGTSLEQYIPLA